MVALPAGRPTATRSAFNRKFIADFAADWELYGAWALMKLRRHDVSNYVKMAAFLVPKQMQVEHTEGVKGMTDEQLEEAIAVVKAALDRAKVIEGSVAGSATERDMVEESAATSEASETQAD